MIFVILGICMMGNFSGGQSGRGVAVRLTIEADHPHPGNCEFRIIWRLIGIEPSPIEVEGVFRSVRAFAYSCEPVEGEGVF